MSNKISSDSLKCIIEVNGGVVSELKYKDQDILFPYRKYLVGDVYKNRGGIPFLFPNAGKSVLDESKGFDLSQHGFARDMEWKILAENSSELVLGLSDNEETLKVYPFQFELMMIIEVKDNAFYQTITVNNNSGNDMPVALGFHPYFYVPIEEKPAFEFKIEDFESTEYIENQRETEFTLKGIAKIKMETSENLKTLAIWSEPNRPHICLEPWVGPEYAILDDSKNITIRPGESETFTLKLVINPAN